METRLFTDSGINTEAALRFYDWAEELAQKKAAEKAQALKLKNTNSILELKSGLQSLLLPEKPGVYSINELKTLLQNKLKSASDACKKYYSAADLGNDLETLLKNSEQIEPLYDADLTDQLKMELFSNQNQLYSADEIMKKLNSIFTSKAAAKYDATDVAKLINQLLLQKQQVAYAGEEVAEELKAVLDPIVMGASFDIIEDYPKFYDFVFNWDTSNNTSEEQHKCGTVQQVLLVFLENMKEYNREIFMDQYFIKISTSVTNAIVIKEDLTDSAKDKKSAVILSQKIAIMHAMISWLNREIHLGELQEIVGDNFLHCNDIGIDTDKLLKEVISFNGSPEELAYFNKTQPLIYEICQTIEMLNDSEKSVMNYAKINILTAMKYHVTAKPFLIREDGYPLGDDTLEKNGSATLTQVFNNNPAYKEEHKFTAMFRKVNEIDKLKQKMDSMNISPNMSPRLK